MTRVREGRVANVALTNALRAQPIDEIATAMAAAVASAINADIRGPYRLWIAKGRAVHVKEPYR